MTLRHKLVRTINVVLLTEFAAALAWEWRFRPHGATLVTV